MAKRFKLSSLNNFKFEFANKLNIDSDKKIKFFYEDLDKKRAELRSDIEQTCSRLESMGIKDKAEGIRNNLKF